MRKFVAGIVLILGITTAVHSQTASIKGTVTDTVEKKNLSNAVIMLLRKSDSTLIKFTRTNAKGEFTLPDVPADSSVLIITYPKYADFADIIAPRPSQVLDLGKLALIQKAILLQEVIVHSVGAIRIKGDTTEFVADSFKLKEGATVEDLLKKLLGLSVNSKGEITAQGKQVDKVLVDGEEFFGNDPTIATQNIAAEQVDKVRCLTPKPTRISSRESAETTIRKQSISSSRTVQERAILERPRRGPTLIAMLMENFYTTTSRAIENFRHSEQKAI